MRRYQELIDLELLKMARSYCRNDSHLWFCQRHDACPHGAENDGDAWTRNPEDAQKTFDLLGKRGEELFWIEGTTKRFGTDTITSVGIRRTSSDSFAKHMQ